MCSHNHSGFFLLGNCGSRAFADVPVLQALGVVLGLVFGSVSEKVLHYTFHTNQQSRIQKSEAVLLIRWLMDGFTVEMHFCSILFLNVVLHVFFLATRHRIKTKRNERPSGPESRKRHSRRRSVVAHSSITNGMSLYKQTKSACSIFLSPLPSSHPLAPDWSFRSFLCLLRINS